MFKWIPLAVDNDNCLTVSVRVDVWNSSFMWTCRYINGGRLCFNVNTHFFLSSW
jgi:hypothetical protein